LSRAQQVNQPATDGVTADGIFRYDSSIRIGQEEPPSGGASPRWEDTCQSDLSLVNNVCGTVERPLQTLGGEVGHRLKGKHFVSEGLPTVVEHLNKGPDADRREKRNNQDRDGTSQKRLCGQEPPIRRIGDRLREALNRIGMCRRTRHIGARHRRPPFGISPVTLETEGCAASLPESLVDWNRWAPICRESDESIV